jgi:hypothetical protein
MRVGYFESAEGNTPAALSASWRSHCDSSNPSRAAAAMSAAFCSLDTRIRTTSSLVPFVATTALAFLGSFGMGHNVATV